MHILPLKILQWLSRRCQSTEVYRWCVSSSRLHEWMKLSRLAVSLQAVSCTCRLLTLAKNSASVWTVLLWGIGSCLSREVWQMPCMCLRVWAGNSGHWWMSGGNPSPLCPVSPSACLGILCRQALETDRCVPDLHRSCYTMRLNTEATNLNTNVQTSSGL